MEGQYYGMAELVGSQSMPSAKLANWRYRSTPQKGVSETTSLARLKTFHTHQFLLDELAPQDSIEKADIGEAFSIGFK